MTQTARSAAPSRADQQLQVSIDLTGAGSRAVLWLRGELDLANAPQIDAVSRMLRAGGCHELIVGASELSFCDCAGLGALVRAEASVTAEGGKLVVIGASRQFAHLLTLTGLQHWLSDGTASQSVPRGAVPSALLARVAEMTGALADAPSLEEAFAALVCGVGALIEQVAEASVTVPHGHGYRTVAATSAVPERIDSLQYQLGCGPCVQAASRSVDAVYTGDLRADERWPELARRIGPDAELGAVLSVPLYADGQSRFGALNLYAKPSADFGPAATALAAAVGRQAAIALTAARERHRAAHLDRALSSNRHIGMALGIIMARRSISAEQAFDLLSTASQRGNRKLVDVAGDVVYTGILDRSDSRRGARR